MRRLFVLLGATLVLCVSAGEVGARCRDRPGLFARHRERRAERPHLFHYQRPAQGCAACQ